jgi:Protein of unknown function (DUF2867)
MNVEAVEPNIDTGALLAGAQFSDAYSIATDATALDARQAAEKMLARGPRWIDMLVSLRNLMVAPFGLKPGAPSGTTRADIIGIFPVVSETQNRLVAGFNDKHLEFRVVVDVAPCGQGEGKGQNVTLTTLVLTHNLFGRIYLAVIMPFHRLIAPTMLRKVAT